MIFVMVSFSGTFELGVRWRAGIRWKDEHDYYGKYESKR